MVTPLTEEEYLEIERKAEFRSEFLDGVMYAMAGGSPEHARIHVNLTRAIATWLANSSCEVFGSELRLKVMATGLNAYPDLSIVCGELAYADQRRDCITNPVVLIEVLSPGTEAYDRGAKFHHYQRIPTLQEYILVSQSKALVECYVRESEERWSLQSYRGQVGVLPIEAVGIAIPLGEIWERVAF